jgi:phosphoglycolate phosphatase
MLRVILFDLDGTLMDTAPEIADALNDTLQRAGHEPVAEDLVRSWIGDGARALLGKALRHVGAPAGAEAQAWPGFAQDYEQRCGSRSVVHEGVRPLLRRLREQDLRLVLLTNKEGAFARRLLTLHGLVDDFDLIVAGDSLPVKKPHPGVVTYALDALHAEPVESLLVGDSAVDVRTARAAGIPVWLVRHGYLGGELSGDHAPDGFIEHFDLFNPCSGPRETAA